MSAKRARMRAEQLIRQMGIKGPMVDVEHVARSLGLQVMYSDLGPGVSGLLVWNGAVGQICVQKGDHPNRRRFTIGHEIGHFVLRHQFEGGEHVHVDRGNYISERGPRAAGGVDPKEIEANQFAASLLMPTRLLRERVAHLGPTPLFDQHVSQLATEFGVSEQAMTIRLTWLGLL